MVSNEDLLRQISAARGLAHRAPFAEWSKDHRGHSAIVHHTRAWAERSNELFDLMDEAKRRGLAMPPCDCPSDALSRPHNDPADKPASERVEGGK